MELRALGPEDIPGWVELLDACAAADRTGEHYSAEDLVEDLESPGLDLARDTLAVLRDGRLAGYGSLAVRETTEPVFRVALDSAVHPEHRGHGVGTELLRWAIRTAEQRQAAEGSDQPLNLRAGLPEADQRGARLLTKHGFSAVRWFSELTLELAADRPAPGPDPAGLTLLPYAPEFEEPLRILRNDAFADHWGAGTWTIEEWRHYKTRSRNFRPELTWLALTEDGTPVGMAITMYYEADTDATGVKDAWIDIVGTAASHRKRGIASALIGRVGTSATELGYQTMSLGVDAASPTGADALYRSLGFQPERTTVTYDRIAAGPGDA
ncbi:GNAT family N-acetyltransferase [Microlunatus speluncae]|uniref:GNAT family N-acetyltransferase n=1 Tax=Microlunatus speluncae TaxID=2594267 RepID=UPI00137643AC|nr:GNAT family N-acetyltransferase [Microlunatus speluncae]